MRTKYPNGVGLFGRVYRIVAHARRNAAVFAEALKAWGTGVHEGQYVFGERDPGPIPTVTKLPASQSAQESDRLDDPN